jgi:hypothetical protein
MSLNEKNIKVILFGASVSAQSRDDSYWYFLKKWEAKCNLNSDLMIDLSRVTFPSAYMSDAGLFNLDHIIAYQPDVVVLDWLSTEEQNCDVNIIDMVYKTLQERGIYIITTAMVRLDTWDKVTEQYNACFNQAQSKNMPFIDFSEVCKGKELRWNDVTKDGVHTTAVGASLYSATISDAIEKFMQNIPVKSIYKEFTSNNAVLNDTLLCSSYFRTISIPLELTISKGQTLRLSVVKNSSAEGSKIWCKQTVGAYSPVLDVKYLTKLKILTEEKVSLFDQWCHFDRYAFKPLANMNFSELEGTFYIEIKIADEDPDLNGVDKTKLNPIHFLNKKLRLHDRLCSLNCSIYKWEVLND